MSTFKAFRIFNDNNKIAGRIAETKLDDIAEGEVVFQCAYSSVNYKDALAATGTGGKIIRKYPLTGGIDSAGTVISSSDARFKAGDEVICTSYDLGVAHDGGYAGMMRVRADWVVPLPAGLTLSTAGVLSGTPTTAASSTFTVKVTDGAARTTTKSFTVVLKSDVQGSLEAIKASLEKLSVPEAEARILHAAVGGINESDVTLAKAAGAKKIGRAHV